MTTPAFPGPDLLTDEKVLAVLRLFDTITCLGAAPVIAVAGPPAAGKTTLTQRIAAARPEVVVLDKDTITGDAESRCMTVLTGVPDDRDSEVYRAVVLPHTLALVATTATMYRDAGVPVLLDLPFIAQANAAIAAGEHLRQAITQAVVPVDAAVWLSVTAEQQQARMISRGAARDADKLRAFTAYRATLGAAAEQVPVADLHLS